MEYSTWNKWDLHIHTRASKVKCGNNEYFGSGDSFTDEECKTFSDTVMGAGVKLVAITDHYHFNATQFMTIKKAFTDSSGNALPGVELKVFYYLNKETKQVEYPLSNDYTFVEQSKPLHCVIIFNDDNVENPEFYNRIQTLFETLYLDTDCIYIGDIIDATLHNNYEFILIPHFVKHNDLEKVIKDSNGDSSLITNMNIKTKWIVGGFFSGLDGNVSKIKQSKIRAINYLDENYECQLPAIMTSDNHDYRTYSSDLSEYKALTTFNGLKLCFSDFSQRVRYQTEDIVKNDTISKLSIESEDGVKILNCKIEFSTYLNCIIGGRSSGKSLLLALIGKAVGERTNNHIDQSQMEDYNKFMLRYKKYIDNSIIKLLRADGTDYDGKIDIYLQDSIIKRFESNDTTLLASDFKEEFNETNSESLEIFKVNLINEVKLFIDLIDKLSIEKKTLKSRGNVITSLQLPSISNNFIVYTDQANSKYEKIKNDANNLQLMYNQILSIENNYSDTLNNNSEIKTALQTLIDIVNLKLLNSLNTSNEFNSILEIINSINLDLNQQYDQSTKQFSINRQGILSLTIEIITAIKTNAHLRDVMSKITSISEIERSSQNIVGNYKFVVKYSSKITSAILISILNDFRVTAYGSDSLESFVETYVTEDKKWSHSRTSENIKHKIEEEINKHIKKEYQIYEEEELINEMSEGRKASVFIDILLNKDHNQFPIIIDQPEDNMDNQDITRRLVDSLRNRKNNRQIFVVTHNPNVLINGDAENVIIANKNDSKEICYINSAIEYNGEFNMIKRICTLVEGGTNAFLKREKKYGLELTDSNNYGGVDND